MATYFLGVQRLRRSGFNVSCEAESVRELPCHWSRGVKESSRESEESGRRKGMGMGGGLDM